MAPIIRHFFKCFRYIKLLRYILETLIKHIFFFIYRYLFNCLHISAVYYVRSYAILWFHQNHSKIDNFRIFFRIENIERHLEQGKYVCPLLVLGVFVYKEKKELQKMIMFIRGPIYFHIIESFVGIL